MVVGNQSTVVASLVVFVLVINFYNIDSARGRGLRSRRRCREEPSSFFAVVFREQLLVYPVSPKVFC